MIISLSLFILCSVVFFVGLQKELYYRKLNKTMNIWIVRIPNLFRYFLFYNFGS